MAPDTSGASATNCNDWIRPYRISKNPGERKEKFPGELQPAPPVSPDHRGALPVKRAMPRPPIPTFVAALCLLAGSPGAAHSQAPEPADRGELLYSTYCGACHRSEIHWRDKRLATDWQSLTAQVRRWQGNTGLDWDEGDTAAIARYLNARFYKFPAGDIRD